MASRLAMVVSDDGEAENAGRALGHLARRLGLSGGQLKEIFMAGALTEAASGRLVAHQAAELDRLEREIATLRKSLRLTETSLRGTERERDALQHETVALRSTLFHRRTAARTRNTVAVIVVVAAILAAAIAWLLPLLGPSLSSASLAPALAVLPGLAPRPAAALPTQVPGSAVRRTAIVRTNRARVLQLPDPGAPAFATLPAGTKVVVRRELWNMLIQWAEIEVGNTTGYVQTTDIDIS
jgi:hypothetical protein